MNGKVLAIHGCLLVSLACSACSRTLYELATQEDEARDDQPVQPSPQTNTPREDVPAAPQPREATEIARGVLAAERVERVVQRHRNEVRFCREQQPSSAPQQRSIAVRFSVSPTGSVTSAEVENPAAEAELAKVELCVAQAVRRWTFPAPTGGDAQVTYEFVP